MYTWIWIGAVMVVVVPLVTPMMITNILLIGGVASGLCMILDRVYGQESNK